MPQKNFVLDQDVTALMTDAAAKGYTPEDMELICPNFTQLLPAISRCTAGLNTIAASAPFPIYNAWLKYSLRQVLTAAESLPSTLRSIRNTLEVLPYTAELPLLRYTSNQLYECPNKETAPPIFFSAHLACTKNSPKKKLPQYIDFCFLVRRCPIVLRCCKYLRSVMVAAALLYTRKE
ncbi:hypothetical protein [Corynebacterium silvaticum]|uniref:Uncharacterized protein n=1 Tax=Corynebacterium silvaticum TaxID=2320431 RepID=A0ACD4PXZ9_9CORY|nr:hypothetical protein [Corynebacterium silvaticum]WCV10560.1 hypothetical protein CBE74_12700 [Corynebacterium silvaticum]